MSLPKVGDLFETVEFIGSNETNSQKLIEFYHREGVDNRFASIIDKRLQKKLICKKNSSKDHV